MKRNGFTLIELLVVIVIISVLATLVVGGANYAVRVSREKRRVISCQTLQTAIYRYRTEYNRWPGGVTPSKKSHTFEGKDNAKVFGPLRATSNDNPDKISFIDETAFFTPDGDGGAVKLSETNGDQPLVFASRSGRWRYTYDEQTGEVRDLCYRVVINFEDETVTVDTVGEMFKRTQNGTKKATVDLFYDEDEAETR